MKKIIPRTFLLNYFLIAGCVTTPVNKNLQQAAHYNVELGLSYLQQAQPVRAKHKLLLANQQAPNDPVIQDAMGYFYERTGEMQLARQHYAQAIQLAPQSGAAQNNYGTFLCRQGNYQQAIAHFMLAVKDPNYLNPAQAYKNAGLCALKIPDKSLAMHFMAKAQQRLGLSNQSPILSAIDY